MNDEAALAGIYREVSPVAAVKTRPKLDPASRSFLAASTFAVIGTSDVDGRLDVSPRGGPPGFLHVLDDERLAIADLSGNNRLDCIRNVVRTGRIGMLVIVTGQHETVRVNGRAWLTTDPDLLDHFSTIVRRPRAAIGVDAGRTLHV